MKIALAGNPNSGKTTLFNAITGKTEYVGNWPGVTVEKKEADLRRVFRRAANRALAELGSEAGIGAEDGVAAANGNSSVRVDRSTANGNSSVHEDRSTANGNSSVQVDRSTANGNSSVHEDRSTTHDGSSSARGGRGGWKHGRGGRHGIGRIRVVDLPGAYSISPYSSEEAITRDFVTGEDPDVIINIIDCSSLERSLFFTTQLLELGIPMVIALNKVDIIRRHGDKIDAEGLSNALNCRIVEVRANEGEGLDRLIEEAVMASVRDRNRQPAAGFSAYLAESGSTPTEPDEIDRARQAYTKKITGKYFTRKRSTNDLTLSDKIDRVVAHPVFGLLIFALIMWSVYAISINGIGGWASGYINEVLFAETIPNALNSFFESIGLSPFLQTLIVDGAVGGVGAVLGFIPLIMVLFFCLALLEDSGYMARVAVVMDRYFKKIGLSGRSIIPMIVGTGCSIPGVMTTRTIEDDTERRITIILTPFMPCGAKLPVIALFAAVFFPGATWVFPAMYLLAILVIITGGLLLRRIFRYKGENISSFILELPEYKLPSLRHALRQMFKQAMAFIRKAATIILVMNTLVWFMQMYGWNFQPAEDQSLSILATIGGIVAPLLIPLGLATWQMASSIVTGFIAKENVVATLAILLAASEDALYSANGPLTAMFTPVTAFAFLAFNLFAPPCFAAVGAMNSELGGRRWIFKALLFQLGMGYTVAMLINQIGTLIVYGRLANGALAAVTVGAALAGIIITIIRHRNSKARGINNVIKEGNVL